MNSDCQLANIQWINGAVITIAAITVITEEDTSLKRMKIWHKQIIATHFITAEKRRKQYMILLPAGETIFQLTVGSGFPLAEQTRLTLEPSLTTMSLDRLVIFGGTKVKNGTGNDSILVHIHYSNTSNRNVFLRQLFIQDWLRKGGEMVPQRAQLTRTSVISTAGGEEEPWKVTSI